MLKKDVTSYKLQVISSKAFTLVELLVTIAIIVLLLATGIPAFQRHSKHQRLTQQAEFFKDYIITARNYALSPQYDKPSAVTHYIFQLEDNGKTYKILRGSCDEFGVKNMPIPTEIQSSNLPEYMKITASSNQSQLCFSIVEQGQMIYPEMNVNFILTSAQTGNIFRIISINKITGQVSISKE